MTEIDTADRLAIQELVARYNLAWDHDDYDGVAACFVPDGVFRDAMGEEHAGHEAIRAFGTESRRIFGRMRHLTSSHLVDLDDDGGVRHRCYMVFVSHPQDERVLDTGEYDDRVTPTADGWRFVRREIAFD
jgi:ketosteroid isomerase-like protein